MFKGDPSQFIHPGAPADFPEDKEDTFTDADTSLPVSGYHPKSFEDFLSKMNAEGSLPLGKNERHFENAHINNTNQEEKIKEIQNGKIITLQEAYEAILNLERNSNVKQPLALEKLHLIQEMNATRAGLLYRQLTLFSSKDEDALQIRNEIREVFMMEASQIGDILREDVDPSVQAFVSSRNLELKKMEIELEIRWKEKEAWDLRVDWSEEKEIILNDIKKDKAEKLIPVIKNALAAFKTEQGLLQKQKGSIDWSERLGYVTGRIHEFEGYLGEYEKAKSNP